MKVGLITHLSKEYPLLPAELSSGLSMGLAKPCEIIKAHIGVNANEDTILEEAQKLLLEDIDYLIAYLGIANLVKVQDLAIKMGKQVLLIDSSAQLGKKVKKKEGVFWLSLQLKDSLLWAGLNQINKTSKVAMLADFINAGYHFAHYFDRVIKKNGGEIRYQRIVNFSDNLSLELESIAQQLIEEEITEVFVNAHGEEGELYLSLARHKVIREKLPNLKWIISDGLFQELSISTLFNNNIESISTWHKEILDNIDFRVEYKQQTKREPTLFSVIGFECGSIITQLEDNNTGSFISPRGKINWDEENRSFEASLKQFRVNDDGESFQINEVELTSDLEEIQMNLQLEELASGWSNAYLCY